MVSEPPASYYGRPSAIVVTITLFVLGYFWNEQPSVSKRKWLLAALFILAFALRIEKLPNVYDRPASTGFNPISNLLARIDLVLRYESPRTGVGVGELGVDARLPRSRGRFAMDIPQYALQRFFYPV